MSTPILATKLYLPPPRPKLIHRPRLIERLNEGLRQPHGFSRKLTLISAAAGFGKTTLLSEWVNQKDEGRGRKDEKSKIYPSPFILHPSQIAWLSLDEADSDPARFLTYLVAALQTVARDVGKGVLVMLQSSPPPALEAILTSLLNDMTAIPHNVMLILDDYHVLDAPPIDQALSFMLDHLPPQMHLVIASREDPSLPLARLRARDQLTELRAADLRFTPAEAAEFLNQAMGLSLSAAEITALESRTEGWIAGLQLAALALQGDSDSARFIQSFSGSHHFVLDYLLAEVLHQQPDYIQTFLLQTAVLDRLCAPLCDAVLGKDEKISSSFIPQPSSLIPHPSSFMLAHLERANLFITPLDNERRWYRYHHLFVELLRQRLHQQQPGLAADLHIRASIWYDENGFGAEAFHHAAAAADFERAAALAERLWPDMDHSFQSAVWLGWVKQLPDELIRNRPVLCTHIAFAFMDAGELEASESWLRAAERRLEDAADGMVVVDEAQLRGLPARIALGRAYNAQSQGNFSDTMNYARLALALTPEEDAYGRAQAAVTLGFTHWVRGDLQAAHNTMVDWVNSMRQAGNIVFVVASTFALADILISQGRLREAVRAYEQALPLAAAHGGDAQRITAHHYLGLAMLAHEMGDAETAAQFLLKAEEQGKHTTLVDWPCRWRLAQAQLQESAGEWEAALALLDEAKRLYVRIPVPDVRPIEALKARVWLKQGRLAEAQAWARERHLSAEDEPSYLREFEHMMLARVLVAEFGNGRSPQSIQSAIELLARLLNAAEASARMGSMLEILIVQAFAHQAQGSLPLALASLEHALMLAEPEGYVRLFVDEGPPMAALLDKMQGENDKMKAYIHKLRSAFGKQNNFHPSSPIPYPSSLILHPSKPPLFEPLSPRELEVLQLIAQGLSNQQIAEQLFLALDTVKGHNRRIYDKLHVQRRTEAVVRARELGLL